MRIRILIAALAAVITPVEPAHAQRHAADAKTIAHIVDSVASEAVAAKIAPALGVAVTMDGRIIMSKSYGMADVTARIPADDRTLWYLASTSKSFTGFGISLLAQRGELKFDSPITSLLPNAKWNPKVQLDSLTLAKFLSHTHHINDNAIVQSAAFTGEIPESQWPSLIALAEPTSNNDLVYSNFGYNIAAMIIDRLHPEGWKKFLERNVNQPAGLRETYTRVTGIEPRRIARPARFTAQGKYVTEPFFKTDRTMNSAGGHIATLRDLARWTIVQMDSGVIDGRRVFPKEAVKLSQTLIAKQTRDQAKRFAYFDREGWGAGWDIGTYEGERMVSRFGSYGATRSHLSFLPARRIGVVAMSTGGPSVITDVIAALAYDLEAGKPEALQRAAGRLDTLKMQISIAPKGLARQDSVRAARQRVPLQHALSDFTGSYQREGFGRITFSREGDHLNWKWGDLYGPAEIFDGSKDQMRIELVGSGSVVAFKFGASGPAEAISIDGLGFTRVK